MPRRSVLGIRSHEWGKGGEKKRRRRRRKGTARMIGRMMMTMRDLSDIREFHERLEGGRSGSAHKLVETRRRRRRRKRERRSMSKLSMR